MRTSRRAVGIAAGLLVMGWTGVARAQAPAPAPAPEPPAVRITSPLGRTGVVGTVRIVAQIESSIAISMARFMVDGEVIAEVENGPPWAARNSVMAYRSN